MKYYSVINENDCPQIYSDKNLSDENLKVFPYEWFTSLKHCSFKTWSRKFNERSSKVQTLNLWYIIPWMLTRSNLGQGKFPDRHRHQKINWTRCIRVFRQKQSLFAQEHSEWLKIVNLWTRKRILTRETSKAQTALSAFSWDEKRLIENLSYNIISSDFNLIII